VSSIADGDDHMELSADLVATIHENMRDRVLQHALRMAHRQAASGAVEKPYLRGTQVIVRAERKSVKATRGTDVPAWPHLAIVQSSNPMAPYYYRLRWISDGRQGRKAGELASGFLHHTELRKAPRVFSAEEWSATGAIAQVGDPHPPETLLAWNGREGAEELYLVAYAGLPMAAASWMERVDVEAYTDRIDVGRLTLLKDTDEEDTFRKRLAALDKAAAPDQVGRGDRAAARRNKRVYAEMDAQ
jgi:hypothetical protein